MEGGTSKKKAAYKDRGTLCVNNDMVYQHTFMNA